MWTSGKGTWPKNALRASHSRTVESLPIDQSMHKRSKCRKASRKMKTLCCSSWSRWSMVGRDSDTVVPAVLPARKTGSHSVRRFARRCCDRQKAAHRASPHDGVGALEILVRLVRLEREIDGHGRADTRMRDDLEHPAVRPHTFPHADHA